MLIICPLIQTNFSEYRRALIAGDHAKTNTLFAESKGMSAGSDPDGGYVVLPLFPTDMPKIYGDISPVARLARTVELDARNDTDTPALGLFRVECSELCASQFC